MDTATGIAKHKLVAPVPTICNLCFTMHPLDALGNPVRRALLHELRGTPLSVNELAGRFSISRPAVSRHLRTLEEAGLVEMREQGTLNIYAVRIEGFQGVRAFVDSFWDTALACLEALDRDTR